ncbi:MAG: TetR/AcrR family transcriptional regulator [Spirochaetales bacterium]|nr:TetR/AcrR family transcriptional regulator [Spirochaetales bacterium]
MSETEVNSETQEVHQVKETRMRILGFSEKLFLKHGFSRITVDEIARELCMSKKTIYKYFKNKKAIIREIIKWNQTRLTETLDEIISEKDSDFIDRLKSILHTLTSFLAKLSEPLVSDLKRHNPEIWNLIHEFKKKMSFGRIERVLQEGREKGLIRADIDPQLIILIYFHIIEHIIIPENLYEFSFSAKDIFEAVMKIMYSGILTEEGRTSFLYGGNDE